MKSVSMFFVFLLALCSVQAQNSVLGKWKRVSSIVINADGSKTDLQADMVKAYPCVVNMVYEFVAGGTITADVSGCNAEFRKMMERTHAKMLWIQKGNKITTSTKDGSIPASESTLSFSGNTMTWTSASLIIVYRRV